MVSLPEHRVLHGWGQSIDRWDSEALPYFRSVEPKPVLVSGYLRLGDPTRGDARALDQLQRIHAGWADEAGRRRRFIPLLGVSTHPNDFRRRADHLARAFVDELGLGPRLSERGHQRLAFSMGVFHALSRRPAAWRHVYENLRRKGYEVEGLETLSPTPSADPSAQVVSVAKLWDEILLRANEGLKARGERFGDLEILAGTFDEDIRRLARAIRAVEGPVLVRPMYEAIGGIHRSSIFGPETFKEAWRRFVDLLRAHGAANAELVFHADMGIRPVLERWYPGDEYVDWMAGSVFSSPRDPREWQSESDFAASRGKPYLIAESAPTSREFESRGTRAPSVWSRWFEPYFRFIGSTRNVKAFVYINIDWSRGSQFPDWGNTRVQDVREIRDLYVSQLARPVFMHNEEFWRAYADSADGRR